MPPIDRTTILPGVGVGPIVVGRTTAAEVLALLGNDCRVSRHDPSQEVFEISYDYENDEDYEPDRAAQLTRPATFRFEFGMCQAIEIGVYQEGLATREGIRCGTKQAEVRRWLGEPSEVLHKGSMDTLRYSHFGIDIEIGREDDEVVGMEVFRARW